MVGRPHEYRSFYYPGAKKMNHDHEDEIHALESEHGKSLDIEGTLTKRDLIAELIHKMHYSHPQARQHVDAFVESIIELLVAGNHLKISHLGDFIQQDKSARPGRNPKTGEPYEVSARRVVKFHSGYKLKNSMKDL
jgi:integration host factor subunit alpha